MKFFKFLGWTAIGFVILSGMTYWFLPTIGRMLITQELTNRGFTNVEIHIDRPNTHALTIPSLMFRTPRESGATSIHIDNTIITYSLDSLLNRVVETVNIEHMKIAWDSSVLEQPSSSAPSLPTQQTGSPFDLMSLGSGVPLPVLPFQQLHLQHVDISHPLAPPTLRHISINASMEANQEEYEGVIHLNGDGLLLDRLTFSLNRNGIVSLIGTHTSAPKDLVLSLQTSLDRSSTALMLHGKTRLKLKPLIRTITALYPLPSEYQSLTGTFSSSWTGTLLDSPSPNDSPLQAIQGSFALDAHLPTWPPFAQDIHLRIQANFSVQGHTITFVLQPTSTGSLDLSLNASIPSSLKPFIAHTGVRTFTWKIQQPIPVVVPIMQNVEAIQIPNGQLHIAMHNASEQLDVRLSLQNLHWKPSNGVIGKGVMHISTHFQPASTPSLGIDSLSLQAHASFEKSTDTIRMTLTPSSFVRLSHLKTETIHIPALESRFPKGLSWTYHAEPQTWELEATTSTLALPSFSLQGKQWKLGDIFTKNLMLAATPERWMIHGETSVKQLRPPRASFKILASNWVARYSASPTSMTINFNGQTLEHPVHIEGKARLNLLTGEGSGTIALKPIQFAPHTLVLSQLIQPWPFPKMEVTHGTISASAEVTFVKNSNEDNTPFHLNHLHGIVDFKEIGGFFKPTILQGLTTRMEILGEDETLRIPPTPLRIKNIQSAVGLTDTSLLFSTERFHHTSVPTLVITNMSTHLLGGKVSLSDAVFDPSAQTHEVTLQVRGLDLKEVLGLEQQETVKGTGTLDGILPLVISGTNVEVHQGSMTARPPGGTLQLEVDEATADSWATSQPQLDLLAQALQNYHYSKLEVGIDYKKNGILKLSTQLEGKNPDFRNGVPIHFNLNIEENIPALMKSLSLVQGLEESIEKMMTERGRSSAKYKQ